MAVCLRSGCNKPTWNGLPGEFCSKTCRCTDSGDASAAPPVTASAGSGGAPLCAGGCGKPTWNGLPGEYCSKSCKRAAVATGAVGNGVGGNAASAGVAMLEIGTFLASLCGNGGATGSRTPAICLRPGCGKPTHNGEPHEFCSISCMDKRGFQGTRCARPGCSFRALQLPDGSPRTFCSSSCSRAPRIQFLQEISDARTVADVQRILDASLKPSWTRDRGCALHGTPNSDVAARECGDACRGANPAAVPSRLEVVQVFRNANPDLYRVYAAKKTSLQEHCRRLGCKRLDITTAGTGIGADAAAQPDRAINEWYVFHGAPRDKRVVICERGFDLFFVGLGGTAARRPLYGWGAYTAERSTKADEYARPDDRGLCAMLICRMLGGRVLEVATDGTTEPQLISKVSAASVAAGIPVVEGSVSGGDHHSVFGDRNGLGKPFNELVVYDTAQLFPEYLVIYRRR